VRTPEPSALERGLLANKLLRELQMLHQWQNTVHRHNAEALDCPAPRTTLYGLMLEHGVGRWGRRLPTGWRKRADHLCYNHATVLAVTDEERFIYCEGYAMRQSLGIVTGMHAWVLDRGDGYRVVDNTWRRPVEAVYFGIPLKFSYLQDAVHRKGTYGVLIDPDYGYPILRAEPEEFLHNDAALIPRDFPLPLGASR
jgi:hypothetical protein